MNTYNQQNNGQNLGLENLNNRTVVVVGVALFIDSTLKSHLRNNLLFNDTQISLFAKAYVEQVDAIFSRLESKSIKRVYIELREIMIEAYEGQFSDRLLIGDIDHLLSNFCLYQMNRRDQEISKWDLAILLTSMDLFSGQESESNTEELSMSTMGISPVGGIQWPDLSCSLVEFGVGYNELNTIRYQVNPTVGFASASVAAHEMAHNLGLYHDGSPFNEKCSQGSWIMSPNNFLNSLAINWSQCSSNTLDQLDLSKYERAKHKKSVSILPGQVFDAQIQCRMHGKSLRVIGEARNVICNETLRCIDQFDELYDIGPALEGTSCGSGGLVCIQNSCTKSNVGLLE